MKKSIIILLLLLCRGMLCFGQITIEECYRLARDNYPLMQRYGLIEMSEKYNVDNASKACLPQFSLSGKATYQTDVTKIPITIPGYDIPELSKDQYQVLAEVSQVIWDGGATRASREAARAQGAVDRAQFEVDMYTIRERVSDLFFGILLLDEQLRLNELYLENLMVSHDRVTSYIENGVANRADLDAVRVEQLGAGQSRVMLQANRSAYMRILSAFIGKPLGDDAGLVKPDPVALSASDAAMRRPEMGLYEAMELQMRTQKRMIDASSMPRLGLFVQGGYGKPGLNMLEDRFRPFAIGGVRLSWQFGSLYTRKNDLRKIENGIGSVGVMRETFLFNMDIQQAQLDAEYRKYVRVMEDDDEIIRMRANIVRASEARLANGVMSASDLMRDMIMEQNARVGKAVHEIELLQTIYRHRNLTNN